MRRLALVLLLFCVVFSLGFISAEDTPTLLGVDNQPPYIIANFSDIDLLAGVPSINYLDLDDYFAEDNGEELNITWETTLTNITITVNSQHQVSFYPDTGYIGTGQLRFTVADSVGNVTGNWFTVNIGEDNQAPRWFNPQKSKINVYQNNIINFTATWTDNIGLSNFIFSIDQGTNWVNSTINSFTGLTNQSLFNTIISAPPGTTVSWRFYAQDVYGNVNATPVRDFTVSAFDFSDLGDDNKEDEGSLADDLASIIASDELTSEAEVSNFKVDTNNIKLSVRQGDTISRVVRVTNIGQEALAFTTDISSLEYFAVISDSGFRLEPGESKDLTIDFKIPERIMPDQYFGYLRIEADEAIDIPIILDVRAFESEISLNVFIPERYKTTRAGKEARAVVTIISTKDLRNANLSVFYAIKNFQGDILESDTLGVELFSSFEDVFVLTVPQETRDGEYLFYVRATGEDLIDIGSDNFFVGARFKILRILQRLFYPLLFLIGAAIVMILIMVYKRNKERQKALELYIMLNEMRSLVKQGKMEEAVEIYKRIKVAYRQHISSDFQKDKEKLKGELNKFAGLLNQNPITEEKPPAAKPSIPAKPGTKPQPKTKGLLPPTKPQAAKLVSSPLQQKISPQATSAKSIIRPPEKNQSKLASGQQIKKSQVTSPPPQKTTNPVPVIKNMVKKILPLKAAETAPLSPSKKIIPTKTPQPLPAKAPAAKPQPPVVKPAPTAPTKPATQLQNVKKKEAEDANKKV